MTLFAICVHHDSYSKCFANSKLDSLKEEYAILQYNTTSKLIRVYFEDGSKKEYPVSVSESISTYSNEKLTIVLMKQFSALKKEGYILIDSFDDKPWINFVFIKSK